MTLRLTRSSLWTRTAPARRASAGGIGVAGPLGYRGALAVCGVFPRMDGAEEVFAERAGHPGRERAARRRGPRTGRAGSVLCHQSCSCRPDQLSSQAAGAGAEALSTRTMRAPIQRITGTAMLLPRAR